MGSLVGEFFFNFVFAATAATITSGALAERVELVAYLKYCVLLTGFVQPVTVHWTWSNGFLLYPSESFGLPANVFFRDYAGGCNVHAVGGVAALVGCAFIGPRIGKYHYGKDGKTDYHIPGHSTPLACLGGFILVTGFLGMALGHGSNIELSSTNMIIGGSISGLTAMLAKYLKTHYYNYKHKKAKPRYWSFLILVDAVLCGMVAMCSGANIIEPYGAAFIGFVASFVFMGTEHLIHNLGLDDPLGSIAVHLGGGLTGILLIPFFMRRKYGAIEGILYWEGCEKDIYTGTNSTAWSEGDCLYTPFYQLGQLLEQVYLIPMY